MDQRRIRLLWFWVFAIGIAGLAITALWAQYREPRIDRVVSGERIRAYQEIPLLEAGGGLVR